MSTKKKRRVLGFTGIRSDYDLMSGLYKRIHGDPDFELGLIVAGAHLSDSYGYTIRYIEKDGLPVEAAIETLLDSDRASSRLKSASLLLQNCLHNVERFKPDLLLFAGDREDVIVAALVGAYLGIPSAHFFGGDHASDGNVDNPVRHATSKLATAHFVAHSSHAERLLSLGEPKNRIFHVGSPALDKFVSEPKLSKAEVLQRMASYGPTARHSAGYALMVQHPILGQEELAGQHFEETLGVLKKLGIPAFVGYPNTDSGSKKTIAVIERYANDPQFVFYKNLDRSLFVNLMRNASFLIGNSSMGLLEAPVIPLAAVNVGLRQRGRTAAENVVFVDQDAASIEAGVVKVRSAEFQKGLASVQSPYGDGSSVEKALQLLRTIDFSRLLRKVEDPLEIVHTP